MGTTRIAAYNVENMFDRPRAMSAESWAEGAPILAAHARVNELIQRDLYDDATKAEILANLDILGLRRSDTAAYAVLRRIRGRFLTRKTSGETLVSAGGRADWIGWVELTTEQVTALATQHTAQVLRDVDAQVQGVVEAESRPLLAAFSSRMLPHEGGSAYEQALLIDGNDDRGIDVGLLTKDDHVVTDLRTHIYDTDASGVIFSRDCAEFHVRVPSGQTLVVLVNHFKSKGYSSADDPLGARRRFRQAARVARIYEGLLAEGFDYVAVLGDLNDSPDSEALAPLLDTTLLDVSVHPDFVWGPRKGTYGSGNEKDKIDYVLLSPGLFTKAVGGGVFRMGVWRGPRTRDPWAIYPTLTAEQHAASDHAAIYADIDWGG